ncbi:MAG: transcription-repair coupling factor [SAR202 cluster bacterium]|nr:transcription-repair coupling factor [SAR202 cluster bacterium]|tara:strand:+ start:1607 stop:5185 length:3579 start_codon:yes stop_codon:yes gene_type:complete
MSLSGLLNVLSVTPEYKHVLEEMMLDELSPQKISVMDAAKPFTVAALWRELKRPMFVILPSPEEARNLFEQVVVWLDPTDAKHVFLYPEPDSLPYERLTTDINTVRGRMQVFEALVNLNLITETDYGRATDGEAIGGSSGFDRRLAPLVIACGTAVIQKTLDPLSFRNSMHGMSIGQMASMDAVIGKWIQMGYQSVPATEVPGTFSRRGGLLDIFPSNSDLPRRIEFFGNRVEDIRVFDPETQRSLNSVSSLEIAPARELIIDGTEDPLGSLDFSNLQPDIQSKYETDIDGLFQGHWFEDAAFYTPLFHSATLLDYIPPDGCLIIDRASNLEALLDDMELQAKGIYEGQLERSQVPTGFPKPYLSPLELFKFFDLQSRLITIERFVDDTNVTRIPFSLAPGFGGKFDMIIEGVRDLLIKGVRVVVVSNQAYRLSEVFEAAGISAPVIQDLDQLPPVNSFTLLSSTSNLIHEGWSLGEDTIFFTDAEVFGVIKRATRIKRRTVRNDAFVADMVPGDFVVHVEHGIAKFNSVIREKLDDVEREYLVLQYADEDKLYVPTDQMDRVSKYAGGGRAPVLTRIGTQEWSRIKDKVKDSARIFAQELVDLYAVRELERGISFESDTAWQQEMEAGFPYDETPDQIDAIYQIKSDMESERPMDRLVCGDVGYGKTEVALRAAFKAVMSGMQVAVLVPTTVLAQQHFNTFSQRLRPYPFKVSVLSRFVNQSDQKDAVDQIREGEIDIVVGTHRLLQNDISFKNLGLVIIDEEQRFGVMHKEKLKSLRRDVDVLTLTATPIPRTLHMALVGVRDMSTIQTPPHERVPIKTYVAEFDEILLREAILRELDRGGQVYFVHNRVKDIHLMAKKIRSLVPEAKIAVGHGQMSSDELESVMVDFGAGFLDVLICTTIIQSGLDISNANTLIVNDAERFGLSQLYQLRGRVGRGQLRAYSYFFYRQDKVLSEIAEKRLKTILDATELGAGFRIAMKDLEIRGAGSLLGTEQSGHIISVGFDLYTRILSEEVARLKLGQDETGFTDLQSQFTLSYPRITVDLPVDAYVPENYIDDLVTRLSVYRRLANVRSIDEIEDIKHDLSDRFGMLPRPVEDILFVMNIRILAFMAGVASIDKSGSGISIRLSEGIGWDRNDLALKFPDVVIGNRAAKLGGVARSSHAWRDRLIEFLERMTGNQGSHQTVIDSVD